jgi:hypothetical protein
MVKEAAKLILNNVSKSIFKEKETDQRSTQTFLSYSTFVSFNIDADGVKLIRC